MSAVKLRIGARYNFYLFIIKALMIQKNNKYDEISSGIQQICAHSLGYFVQHVPLARSNFPILEHTYTLWRHFAYHQISRPSETNTALSNCDVKLFHALSEKKYLPLFIERVENEMNKFSRGMKNVEQGIKQLDRLPKEEEELYQIIIDLGKCVWLQQLYLQLIEDLIRLPYLSVISSKSSIVPRQEYATDYVFKQKKVSKLETMANSAGKNIFNKVLSVLTETIFSKTFIIKVNTLFGTFNPLVIGASFGLTRYLQYLDKKNKSDKLQVQLKCALELAQSKIASVKQIYMGCLEKIELIVSAFENQNEKAKRKEQLKQLFLTTFQEQWLQIQVVTAEDGWQEVRFEQKQSFQEI